MVCNLVVTHAIKNIVKYRSTPQKKKNAMQSMTKIWPCTKEWYVNNKDTDVKRKKLSTAYGWGSRSSLPLTLKKSVAFEEDRKA